MITLPVMDPMGQQISTVEIDPQEFGGTVNRQLLHEAVLMYQANRRAGSHKTKTRGEVAGSSIKMYRQKGTGRARMGSKRTGKRRGGGTIFGPKPRDYSYSIPKQARRLATRMALLSKFLDQEAVIVDGLALAEPKTKRMAQVLGSLGLGGQSCLIATSGLDRNLYFSARNIQGVEVTTTGKLNTWAVLRRKRLLLTKAALDSLRTPVAAASG